MTEVEFSRLLSDLAKSTEVLNKKSDSINTLIERFQETLQKLNPGIEVWLVDQPLESGKRIVEDEHTEEETVQEAETELGFVKLSDVWTVSTRVACYSMPDDQTGEGGDFLFAFTPSPLMKATRKIRIAALKQFPHLLTKIKEAVDTAIRDIEAAEKFVK